MRFFMLIMIFFSLLTAKEGIDSLKLEMEKLDKEATKSKENIFYQPYIISVYKGESLETIGVSTLSEALELIPGVTIYSNNLGVKRAIFRGSNPLAYGQSKLFIDGVCVNDVAMDQYSSFLEMPIELIKRIEIVRGPGSRSDDINVYAGAVYVYTYAECDCQKSKFFTGVGSDGRRSAGFMKKIIFDRDKSLYLEGFIHKEDTEASSGYDILSTGYFGDVNRGLSKKGDIPLWIKNYSLAATINIGEFVLRMRENYYKHAMAYGLSFIIPKKDDFYRFPMRYVEGVYTKEIGRDIEIELKTGLQRSMFSSSSKLAPDGIIYYQSPCSSSLGVFDNGIYGVYEAKQLKYYGGLKFTWKPKKHNIRTGFLLTKEKTTSIKTLRTGPGGVLVDYSDSCPFLDPRAKRDSAIFYIADEYEYSDRLTISYGINVEHNDNTDHELSPRLALVYKQSRDQIYKLSFSRSHRNPSWQELFIINNNTAKGNIDLKPEVVNALEASFIKRFNADDFFQASLFYLRNSDVINNLNDQREYTNGTTVKLYGLELELKKMLHPTLAFYFNYSFVDGRCSCHQQVPNIARHMVKFYLTKQFAPWLDGSVLYEFVSDRKRAYYDDRENLKGYQRVDLSANIWLKEDISLNFAIKNIFDEDIRYPSPPGTYVDDYDAGLGRFVMVKLRWSFQ